MQNIRVMSLPIDYTAIIIKEENIKKVTETDQVVFDIEQKPLIIMVPNSDLPNNNGDFTLSDLVKILNTKIDEDRNFSTLLK